MTKVILYDDFNGKVSLEQDVIGTLTTNCALKTLRNGFKIIEIEDEQADKDKTCE